MAAKPIYAVGLDAGSRRTRMVICVLENGRLRLAELLERPAGGAAVVGRGQQQVLDGDELVLELLRLVLRLHQQAVEPAGDVELVGGAPGTADLRLPLQDYRVDCVSDGRTWSSRLLSLSGAEASYCREPETGEAATRLTKCASVRQIRHPACRASRRWRPRCPETSWDVLDRPDDSAH